MKLFLRYKAVFIFLFFTIAFYHKIILHPNQIIYPSGDIPGIFYAEKLLFKDSLLQNHTLPLWNPFIFSGSPFVGNPTSAMFYPLNILYLLFPVRSVFGFMFAIDSFLIGVFTYLFARLIKLSFTPAITSAVTVMFSGALISLIFAGHLINFDTFIWFPATLFCLELILQKKNFIFSILAGIPIGLSLLTGASQIAIYSLLSAAIYYFLRITFKTVETHNYFLSLKLIIFFAVSCVLGIAFSAVQLIPAAEFSALSVRSNGVSLAFASDFFLHPKQIISFIFPYIFGAPFDYSYWGKGNFWEVNGYIGIVPLMLALCSLFLKRNKYILIFLAIAIFSLLYSFGKYGFIFQFFYNYIPAFKSFRVPGRFLYYYTFSMSILAGFGLQWFMQQNYIIKQKLRFIIIPFLTIFVAVVSFAVYIFLKTRTDALAIYEHIILKNSYATGINHNTLLALLEKDIIFFSAVCFFLGLLILLFKKRLIDKIKFQLLIIIILFIDLFHFGLPLINTVDPVFLTKPPAIIQKIQHDKDIFRVFDMDGNLAQSMVNYRLENITGIHSLYLKQYRNFLWSIGKYANEPYEGYIGIYKISHPQILNVLNVKYILTQEPLNIQSLKLITKEKLPGNYPLFSLNPLTYYLYQNTDFLPRAYIVPYALTIQDKTKIIHKLTSSDFNPKQYVILETHEKFSKYGEPYKMVPIISREPNKIHLKALLAKPGFLVLSEIYYPGWKAYDNGKEVEVYRANYTLRSIYLKEGYHNITFIYNPPAYNIYYAFLNYFLLLIR